MIKINIDPMGCVRMTRRGKWTSVPAIRYLNYKKDIGWQLREQCKEPTTGAVAVAVTFIMPMPESWSNKKKKSLLGHPVTVKPDVDNLVKGLLDSANKICWHDDNQVTDMEVKKRYGYEGAIEMTITAVPA